MFLEVLVSYLIAKDTELKFIVVPGYISDIAHCGHEFYHADYLKSYYTNNITKETKILG